MQFPDLWQFLGSPQLAELTAFIGLALALRSSSSPHRHSPHTSKKLLSFHYRQQFNFLLI
jgi:hypothetical protein